MRGRMLPAAGDMQSAVLAMFSMYALLVPSPVRYYLQSVIHSFFSKHITVKVHELLNGGMIRNQIYDAAEVYLRTKISPDTKRFSIGKTTKQKSLSISLEIGEEILDWFGDDMELKWKKKSIESRNNNGNEKWLFELTFNKKFMDRVLKEYVPFVLSESKEITDKDDKVVKLYTRASTPGGNDGLGGGGPGGWSSINLDHPATFETMAMETELKKAIKDDLKRFLKRKDFYKKVGKAWKRGYLLYGPPGTGKSSLIAAIANYLDFDIYDLELTSSYYDSDLRRMLGSTTNRSILVIEDVDCSVEMQDRQLGLERVERPNDGRRSKLTLSGLLNFIDGLWSSCGDERIIILTTNYIDRLDPALLRPGRMDMHIPMSYCTKQGFKILASKYLGLDDHHKLFGKIKGLIGKIKGLIEKVEATPAELAEELMKSEDAEIALTGVVNLLKRKKMEGNEIEEVEGCETKRFKIERNRRKFVRKK